MSPQLALESPIRFDLPLGQVIDQAGRRLVLVGRARDRMRRLLFEDSTGIQQDFSDEELMTLQASGALSLLTAAEAAEQPHPSGRPPVSLDLCVGPAARAARDKETMRKFTYAAAWRAAGCPSRTEKAIAPIVTLVAAELGDPRAPSPRHCLRWIADYLAAECSADGLVPQTLNRGNYEDRLEPKARELLKDTVDSYYLVGTRPGGPWTHERVKAAFAEYNEPLPPADHLKVPSLTAVYDQIKRIDLYTQEYCRVGKRAADQRFRPIGTPPQVTRANQVWEIDHTRINCVIIEPSTGLPIGRPWITVIIDRYSGMIVAVWISISPPSAIPVFQCLRSAILPKTDLLKRWGVSGEWPAVGRCSVLVPDHGSEFKAASFKTACARLGMDVKYTPVLKPWYKGMIERALQTLTRQVFEHVPGTTFRNIFERNNEKRPEDVAVATLDDLWFHTLNWVVNCYNRRVHRTFGARPVDLWRSSANSGILPPLDPARIDRILTPVYYCRPQRYGATFEGVQYNATDLAELRIRPDAPPLIKLVINANDLGTIGFVDPADGVVKTLFPQGPFRALMPGRTLEQHLYARALQRANNKTLKGEEGLAKAMLTLDDAMRAKSGADGCSNRRDAEASWKATKRLLEPEDEARYTERSNDGIAAEIFPTDHAKWADEPQFSRDVSHNAERVETSAERGVPAMPDASVHGPLLSGEDEVDLDAYLTELSRHASNLGEAP